jgi:hypothetical protein
VRQEREREREMKRDKEWREMRHDMHAWCKLTTMHGWEMASYRDTSARSPMHVKSKVDYYALM